MVDLGVDLPPILTHVFLLVLSKILYKPKVSKLNNFNIGISM